MRARPVVFYDNRSLFLFFGRPPLAVTCRNRPEYVRVSTYSQFLSLPLYSVIPALYCHSRAVGNPSFPHEYEKVIVLKTAATL